MKQLAIAELEPHAQWKENSFPEVLYTKLLSHIIIKNYILPEETSNQDTMNISIASEIKI